MKNNDIYIGNNIVRKSESNVDGQFVDLNGKRYYKISNYDRMQDFFMSIVSDTNLWMFISSNGSLSAGRVDRNNCLFPYYTDDKIHDYKGITGSRSYFLINRNQKTYLWEPFTQDALRYYKITRNIYKSIYSNSIVFEEINNDLELTFRYSWSNSDNFGFVKESTLLNNSNRPIQLRILDGIKNILPHGNSYGFQNEYSNLLDAYKKNELIKDSSLGLFSLSSIPVDKAEPSEALKSTTVWSDGISPKSRFLVSDLQVKDFIAGGDIETEYDVRAQRGAYYVYDEVELNTQINWITVADINKSSADVSNLLNILSNSSDIVTEVKENIALGTKKLKKLVSYSDGLQVTGSEIGYNRHYTNVLYNIMRGGVFISNYNVEKRDFIKYMNTVSPQIVSNQTVWLDQLPEKISYNSLCNQAIKTNDNNLIRITYEYLPLTFSRRHGDPSRPWNLFSIQTRDKDGSPKLNYEGNWRDIFQNWEALGHSFPDFVVGMITRFVNATTIDGYNPYRITRDGLDWEVPDPEDPWAYIGYWGDHQIIYLQKLLEVFDSHYPNHFKQLLLNEIYVYANVPYRIKDYDEIKSNPSDTIIFDFDLDNQISKDVESKGADAKLLKRNDNGQNYQVNFIEKILATLLSKLSNFVPGAGIWMNTQRPEWNDANNALVGNGVSMVTLYYLRRFLSFWKKKLSSIESDSFYVSTEIADLFNAINAIFKNYESSLASKIDDTARIKITDQLGQSHSNYRNSIYESGFSNGKNEINFAELISFIDLSLKYIDHTIKENKRPDGLYHAYNLLTFSSDRLSISHLYEMLEGQVAVLSSGFLNPQEGLNVLNALKKSSMFRKDQYSYMLYPDRELSRFIDKNNIPKDKVDNIKLLSELINNNDTSIIEKASSGTYHFNGDFRNAEVLKKALAKLSKEIYGNSLENDTNDILDLYEDIFDHNSFTGRSGTFYGYEGLGSIYWHMVSKLSLATQEMFFRAVDEGDKDIISQLKQHYYEIKAGIGLYKSPEVYGSFPTDAYSHTPGGNGVKQPGLTGQVKEDNITRFGELGIKISEGKIIFDPSLINTEEILRSPKKFEYCAVDDEFYTIDLKENEIGFTLCQIPVIVNFSEQQKINITYDNDDVMSISENTIDKKNSELIFSRSGKIKMINVSIIAN